MYISIVHAADNLGILTHSALCLSGDELDQLGTNPQHLSATVNRTSVFYRVSPRHKVVIIKVRLQTDMSVTVLSRIITHYIFINIAMETYMYRCSSMVTMVIEHMYIIYF